MSNNVILVLMEKTLKLLLYQTVATLGLMDWPITKVQQRPPDLIKILTAITEQKFTISKQINGMMLVITLLARKFLRSFNIKLQYFV